MLSHVPGRDRVTGGPQCRTDHNIFACFRQPMNLETGLADIIHPGSAILPPFIDQKALSDDVISRACVLYQVKYMFGQLQHISA